MSPCHQYKYERDSLCSLFAFNSFNSHREFQTSSTSPSGPAMFQVSGSHPPPVVMATIIGWCCSGLGLPRWLSAGDAGDAVQSLGREDPLVMKRTSLAVQWLRLQVSTAEGVGLIPGQGTRIPHAKWCSQKETCLHK